MDLSEPGRVQMRLTVYETNFLAEPFSSMMNDVSGMRCQFLWTVKTYIVDFTQRDLRGEIKTVPNLRWFCPGLLTDWKHGASMMYRRSSPEFSGGEIKFDSLR